uniref:Uncharacterized protein n=1 Tax=Anguilla anguilla TaxID=7936 RepID=A0A0E9TCD2_ANGAN
MMKKGKGVFSGKPRWRCEIALSPSLRGASWLHSAGSAVVPRSPF